VLGTGEYLPDLQVTLTELAIAFAISCTSGVTLGYLISRSPYMIKVFEPLLAGIYSVPIILFLPLAAWGWHLALRTVPERRRARLLLWPLAVMLLAAAFSALPQPKSWPLPNGLGGILGDLFMTGALFIGVLPAAAASFVAGLLFPLAGTSLLLSEA